MTGCIHGEQDVAAVTECGCDRIHEIGLGVVYERGWSVLACSPCSKSKQLGCGRMPVQFPQQPLGPPGAVSRASALIPVKCRLFAW